MKWNLADVEEELEEAQAEIARRIARLKAENNDYRDRLMFAGEIAENLLEEVEAFRKGLEDKP